ncbi:zonadhesin [Nephila pilipes]|uniref:Zonadhesin n=1 Tax=Nephila pilipes TaxID=299642 RepID=A0A8X6PV70_NEPPI|nr:zonadhesin [Nephila pilipes]
MRGNQVGNHPNMRRNPGGNPESMRGNPAGNYPNVRRNSNGNNPNVRGNPGGNHPNMRGNLGRNHHPNMRVNPGGNHHPNLRGNPVKNNNFHNGFNPSLLRNNDNEDNDGSEPENQDNQPLITSASDSDEADITSDETSVTDDSQYPPDASNDYTGTQLPEELVDDLLSDLGDSPSDEFLSTTESGNESDQDLAPQPEETTLLQKSSVDDSASNTDTNFASHQAQPGLRRKIPGGPPHRPGGPLRRIPPGGMRNPQMRRRRPDGMRNPNVRRRPGVGGGNLQNGLGPPLRENNMEYDGDGSPAMNNEEPNELSTNLPNEADQEESPEEGFVTDDTNQFSKQPLDEIFSDFDDNEYSLSTTGMEDAESSDYSPTEVTEATALTDDPQIPPGVPDDFPGYKFPDGFISDLISDLDKKDSDRKHKSDEGMKEPGMLPHGEFRDHTDSFHENEYPKKRKKKIKHVKVPTDKSKSKKQPNTVKQSSDIPPKFDESFDTSEPQQHFSEMELDNASLQDSTYPSDFEIITPEITQAYQQDNTPDIQTMSSKDSLDNSRIHVKKNRNLIRPKKHKIKSSKHSQPSKSSSSESEADTATEEDHSSNMDKSFDTFEPQRHFSEIELGDTSSRDGIDSSNFETTFANDPDVHQQDEIEDYATPEAQQISDNAGFVESPIHKKRNRNLFRPKQHRAKISKISLPKKPSTSQSEEDMTLKEDYSSQYPLKQNSLEATDSTPVNGVPYDEWWKHLHTIKSTDTGESTEQINHPSSETDHVISSEGITDSDLEQPQMATHTENDGLKRPHRKLRKPFKSNSKSKDISDEYQTVLPEDYDVKGIFTPESQEDNPLNFPDLSKQIGAIQPPGQTDVTTMQQPLSEKFPDVINKNTDTIDDEDTTVPESSTLFLPSQTENQVLTSKNLFTQYEPLNSTLRRKFPQNTRFPNRRRKLKRRPHPTEADIEAARKNLRQKFTNALNDNERLTVSTEDYGYQSSPENLLTQTEDDHLSLENHFPQNEPFNPLKRRPPHSRRRLHPSPSNLINPTVAQQTLQREQSKAENTDSSNSDSDYELNISSNFGSDYDSTTVLMNDYEYKPITPLMDDYEYKSATALINDYEQKFTTVSAAEEKHESTSASVSNYDNEFTSNPSLLRTDYEYSTLEDISHENIFDQSKRKKHPHVKLHFPNSDENIRKQAHTNSADFSEDQETEPQDFQEQVISTERTLLNTASSVNYEFEAPTGLSDDITTMKIYPTNEVSTSVLTYDSDEFFNTEPLTQDVATTIATILNDNTSVNDTVTEFDASEENKMERTNKSSLRPSHPGKRRRRRRRKKIHGNNSTFHPYPMKRRTKKPEIHSSIPNDFPNFSFPDEFVTDMLSSLTETPSTTDAEINTGTTNTGDVNINTKTPGTTDADINTEIVNTEDVNINTQTPSTTYTEINIETPNTGDTEINTDTLNTRDADINTETADSREEEINTEIPNTGDADVNTETPDSRDAEINTETPNTRDTETPNIGNVEINTEASDYERRIHTKSHNPGRKKKKGKRWKIHRPKGNLYHSDITFIFIIKIGEVSYMIVKM